MCWPWGQVVGSPIGCVWLRSGDTNRPGCMMPEGSTLRREAALLPGPRFSDSSCRCWCWIEAMQWSSDGEGASSVAEEVVAVEVEVAVALERVVRGQVVPFK